MTHTSVRPVRSDWNAMCVPSGEKNGPASMESPGVSAVSLPLSTSTVKIAGLLCREEKNAMRAESGNDDRAEYASAVACVGSELGEPGPFGYTVRVLPSNPLLPNPTELGLVAVPAAAAGMVNGDLR